MECTPTTPCPWGSNTREVIKRNDKRMKKKTPTTYTKLDRIEYIYACLAPYGVRKDMIRKVLDKDEEFAMEVLKGGDIFKYGGLCKMRLRYVSPKDDLVHYDFHSGELASYQNKEHNRITIQPMPVFNQEIKDLTYGDAFYYEDDDEWQEN